MTIPPVNLDIEKLLTGNLHTPESVQAEIDAGALLKTWKLRTLADAYDAAQKVCDDLAADNASFQADAIRMMASLLDTWSQRDTLDGVNVQAAHEIFSDAGPALSAVRRMFDEAVGE